MFTLYIDTHSNYIDIVLFHNGKVLDKENLSSSKTHSLSAMSMVERLLKKNNKSVNEINEIIVVNGPGSFTGIRIGVTIAKTMAYTLNIPIKVIDALSIKAFSAHDNDFIVVEAEFNGKFIATVKDKKIVGEIRYLTNQEFSEYNQPVVEDIQVDYEEVYKNLENVELVNPHSVNPIYVKNIGV